MDAWWRRRRRRKRLEEEEEEGERGDNKGVSMYGVFHSFLRDTRL